MPANLAGSKPTYSQLITEKDRVAPAGEHDRYFELGKEASTAQALRAFVGVDLRSVLRIDTVAGARNPDSVWDQAHATIDIKHPESEKHSAWGKLLGDAISKADGAVFDVRPLAITEEAARATMARALGGHQRGFRVDHVLVIGETESGFWYFWAKGGPR